jgi:hypothetical protein
VTSIGDRAACLFLWRSLLSLVEARGAVAQTRSGGALLEVAAEGRDHERTEDEVGTTASWLANQDQTIDDGMLTGTWAGRARGGKGT